MKKLLSALIGWLVVPIILLAVPNFPLLTDRVVDTAGILTADQTSALITKLKSHETTTSNQIVVVTLKDLNGYDIADYGYQLGRHWKIGQKEKNNGVLLIVSLGDRKVRIEVGYGLEGVLPDARAHEIIDTVIVPAFKQKKFYQGIDQAVDAIIASIAGEYKASSSKSPFRKPSVEFYIIIANIIILLLWSIITRTMDQKDGVKRLLISLTSSAVVGVISWILLHILYVSLILAVIIFLVTFFYDRKSSGSFDYSSSSWGSGSSSSGSSFSGFGGSFGGGGASGSW